MEPNSGPTGPFSAGPGAHGCQACQDGNHNSCAWLIAMEEVNAGAWDHRDYVSLPSYGYCVCAAANEDMHLDPRDPEENEIDSEQEPASP